MKKNTRKRTNGARKAAEKIIQDKQAVMFYWLRITMYVVMFLLTLFAVFMSDSVFEAAALVLLLAIFLKR